MARSAVIVPACLALLCAALPATAAAGHRADRHASFGRASSAESRLVAALTCAACLSPALAAPALALANGDGYDPAEVDAWLDHLHGELGRLDRAIAIAPRGPPWWSVGMVGVGTALVVAGIAVAILSAIHRPDGVRTRADILQIVLYTSLGGTTIFVAVPLLSVFWYERHARRERLIRQRHELQREYEYWNQYAAGAWEVPLLAFRF